MRTPSCWLRHLLLYHGRAAQNGHRPYLLPLYRDFGQRFLLIITAADTDLAKLQLTVETLRGFTDWCLPNPRERGVIIAEGVWKVGEIDDHPAMGRAYEMGKAV